MSGALSAAAVVMSGRRVQIACCGLDVLHQVRLKVAVSLLMADFIQAELREDDGSPVDLLVGDADDARAQQRLLQVAAGGGRVLAISRGDTAGGAARLQQGASVREIHQQLLQLLGPQAEQPDPASELQAGRTLFHWLARSRGQACLLHNGLVKLVIDPTHQHLGLLRDLPLARYAEQAISEGWSCEVLDAEGFSRMQADVVGRCSWEALCWQAAIANDEPLPAMDLPEVMCLQGWPDAAVEKMPSSWLLPIASLLQRPWSLPELASQTGVARLQLRRIAAAACWSGLGMGDVSVSRPAPVVRPPGGLFSRIARRFGLTFTALQVRH